MTATLTKENPIVTIRKLCKLKFNSIQNYDVDKNYVIRVIGRPQALISPIVHPISGAVIFMLEPIMGHISYFELLNVKDYPVLVNYSIEYSSI